MSDNNSIDKLAEAYASDEEDAKIYQKAQASTIINQTRQINELRKKLEELSQQCEQLTIENTKLKALGNGTEIEKGNDAGEEPADTPALSNYRAAIFERNEAEAAFKAFDAFEHA